MRTFKHTAAALVAVLTANGAQAATATVALKPIAEVASPALRLGDIATVSSTDSAAAEALSSLQVGRVTTAVGGTRFERAELARYAQRHLPEGITAIEWTGAQAVSVQMQTVRLEGDELIARGASELRAHLQQTHADVEVRAASRVDALRLPAGQVTLQARLPNDAQARPGRHMAVEVDVLVDGEKQRTVPLWFEVRAQGLTASEAGRLVARGDEVIVETRSGSVVIESRGTALGDGRAGQDIAVRVNGAGSLRARITAPARLAL